MKTVSYLSFIVRHVQRWLYPISAIIQPAFRPIPTQPHTPTISKREYHSKIKQQQQQQQQQHLLSLQAVSMPIFAYKDRSSLARKIHTTQQIFARRSACRLAKWNGSAWRPRVRKDFGRGEEEEEEEEEEDEEEEKEKE